MVRRPGEIKEVGAGGDEHRKTEPPALSTRKSPDRLLVRIPAGEEETAEERLRLGTVELRHPHRAVECRAALVELRPVLAEIADLDSVAELVATGDDCLQERCL